MLQSKTITSLCLHAIFIFNIAFMHSSSFCLAQDSDSLLLEELRSTIESLPEDKRLVIGTELIRSKLPMFRSESARQRTLVSLGDLYFEQMQYEESEKYFREAIEVNPNTQLAVYCITKIDAILITTGRSKDVGAEIIKVPLFNEINGIKRINEGVVSARVQAHIAKKEFAQAIKLCSDLCFQFNNSCGQLLVFAQSIPDHFSQSGDFQTAIEWYDKIKSSIPESNNNPTFRSNQIVALFHCSPNCDQRQSETLQIAIDSFASDFPLNPDVLHFYVMFADMSTYRRNTAIARKYYELAMSNHLIDGETKSKIKLLLESLPSPAPPLDSASSPNHFRNIFRWAVILSTLLILIIGIYVFTSRTYASRNT